jgi:hypothetical protein
MVGHKQLKEVTWMMVRWHRIETALGRGLENVIGVVDAIIIFFLYRRSVPPPTSYLDWWWLNARSETSSVIVQRCEGTNKTAVWSTPCN